MYVTQRVAFLQDQKIPINCKPRYTEFIRQILHGILTAQIQNFNDFSAAFIRLHCGFPPFALLWGYPSA